ncbi:MAG: cyclohexa-1,5-dienecarbonyl-CoA hydratase [Acidobacteria bacterium]|nr:cyclohexa-1,5-dienecarbonyl-CoA hydratase [Acidobacteriota bacterium]NIM62755.1 cyclohexa-1,5-dienecarbonyl-CoA hydratase [Acidobacteriota bacterium]NIO59055.1 cyclohexa-1,5-dienecarbonyl-CoA hydratase [Acidobacteriota bacterium]NIQ30094.1 cyclohexa-1,5-dienecarbonyl-CoA hydratase [Acidobacteriota bacterium]NIQ84897.1 cyclohexa-1,5-dienecarbonyl-CoA hydratase [Acidobacteriota bacterium]
MSDTLTHEILDDGAIWRIRLNTPKANILDMDKVARLDALFRRAADERDLKAVLIEGEGPHFSFGASVEEHLPGRFEAMIPGFHKLFERMFDAEVATLAAVRGQCLGGGLELVAFCNRVFAAADAKFGQPEIVLGVFAPVASVALADRVGRSRAEDLCLSGRSIDTEEALRIGLIDAIADDPAEAALAYARERLCPHSASSLRLAQRAVRGAYRERFRRDLDTVEALYLETLMKTKDANEGLQAFLEKRKPEWSNT